MPSGCPVAVAANRRARPASRSLARTRPRCERARVASSPDRRRRSRSGRLRDGLIWGALLGAAGGAVLGDAIDGLGAAAGALIGAVILAPAEAVMAMTQGVAGPKPLLGRL